MITRRGTAGLSLQRKARPFLQVAGDISYATHIYRRMARDRYAKNASAEVPRRVMPQGPAAGTGAAHSINIRSQPHAGRLLIERVGGVAP
jgi:hypothetical protein